VLGAQSPQRNELVAMFTTHLLQVLSVFAREGFTPFVTEWQRYDVLSKAEVNVLQADRTIAGIARGVSEDGSLLVETTQGMQRFVSGEVSLRAR
jgi:BirA family biotin operon repressor/biotin-[acetyl-CoA-carboxylase] ligase